MCAQLTRDLFAILSRKFLLIVGNDDKFAAKLQPNCLPLLMGLVKDNMYQRVHNHSSSTTLGAFAVSDKRVPT